MKTTTFVGQVIGGGAGLGAAGLAPFAPELARQARVLQTLAYEGQLDMAATVLSARARQVRERLGRLALGVVGRANQPAWHPEEAGESSAGRHVLWALSSFSAGGAEQIDLHALEALRAAGWRISLLCVGPPNAAFADRFRACAHAWIALGGVGLSGPEETQMVEAALERLRPDLMVIRHARSAYRAIPRAQSLGVACVDLIHTSTESFGDWIDAARVYAPLLQARWTSSATVAEALAVRGGGPAERIAVVPVGVNIPAPVHADEQSQARQALGLPTGVPVVGFLGRLAPEKGLLRWLEVAACIRRDFPDAHFLIAGDGPLRQRLKRRVQALGLRDRVSMPGRVDRVVGAYRAMDLYMLTSRFEGLALGPLEAMASGTPALSLDVGAMREGLQGPGTALVAPTAADAEIAARAVALLGNIAADPGLREAVRAYVLQQFALPAMQAAFVRRALEVVQSSASATQPPFISRA